jgi:branched-chain amino acid transport system substrate-binding protein
MIRKALLFGVSLAILSISVYPALGAEPITITGIFPRTGPASAIYPHAVRAVDLAKDEVNQTGGILDGRKLAFEIIDSQSTPLGTQAAGKAAVQMGTVGVIGEYWSTQSLALARVMQSARRPMITPESSSPGVTKVGDCIFRACFNDIFQGRALAGYARQELGLKTAVILINHSQRYSVTLGESFGAHFIRQGGQVIWEASYHGQAADFMDILKIVRRKKPDAVFIPGYSRDCALIVRQAVSIGIKSVFMGGDGWGPEMEDMVGGEALENTYHASHWHTQISSPENRRFLEMYERKYSRDILEKATPLTYDAVMLMVDAIRRANSTDPEKVRRALAETRDFKGATGPIRFDANGDPQNKPVNILKYKNGAWRLMRTVTS